MARVEDTKRGRRLHISVLFKLFTLNNMKLLTTYDKGAPSYSESKNSHNCRMRFKLIDLVNKVIKTRIDVLSHLKKYVYS